MGIVSLLTAVRTTVPSPSIGNNYRSANGEREMTKGVTIDTPDEKQGRKKLVKLEFNLIRGIEMGSLLFLDFRGDVLKDKDGGTILLLQQIDRWIFDVSFNIHNFLRIQIRIPSSNFQKEIFQNNGTAP